MTRLRPPWSAPWRRPTPGSTYARSRWRSRHVGPLIRSTRSLSACYLEWWFGDGAPGLDRDRAVLYKPVDRMRILYPATRNLTRPLARAASTRPSSSPTCPAPMCGKRSCASTATATTFFLAGRAFSSRRTSQPHMTRSSSCSMMALADTATSPRAAPGAGSRPGDSVRLMRLRS